MKNSIRKILFISMWVVLVVGLIVTLGFAQKQESKMLCKKLNIIIHQDSNNYFIETEDIREMLAAKGDFIEGQSISTINVNSVEKLMYTNPWVRTAQAYLSLDGVMQIEIDVRSPLVRLINLNGESFYMDTEGKLMLWSAKYTPRVLVASGNITETYAGWYKITMHDILTDDSIQQKTKLDDIYKMANFITSDPFWNAQISQLNLNTNNELELIPEVGDHTIVFGDITDMKEKFTKLKMFYSDGLNHTGWNIYDTLNLKYKDQVVCTKIKSVVNN